MRICCSTLEVENDELNSNLSIVNENLVKLSKELKEQTRSDTGHVVCN